MPLQKVGSTRPGWSGDTCECKHTHRVTHTITSLLCWSNRVISKADAQSWAVSILDADSVCLSSWHAQLGGLEVLQGPYGWKISEPSSNSAHYLEEKSIQVSPGSCDIPCSGTGSGKDIVNSSFHVPPTQLSQQPMVNPQWIWELNSVFPM